MPITVHVVDNEGKAGHLIAYAQTVDQAIVLMSCVFQTKQGWKPEHRWAVGVFDETGTLVAEVGDDLVQPAPAPPPAPVLSSLVPDSSGDWQTEVQLLGTGFINTSEILANDTAVVTVTFVSNTELRCVVPVTAAGAYEVKVSNDGVESNALTFTAL